MIELTGTGLTPADVVAVAREREPVQLAAAAREAMQRSADVVAGLADRAEPAYGVSTGFGSLAGTWIPPARREELQRALIRSHAAGMGPPVEREVVRAMLFLRARSLAMGRSGARPVVPPFDAPRLRHPDIARSVQIAAIGNLTVPHCFSNHQPGS